MDDKYPHDNVTVNINGEKVDIKSPTAYVVSHRTGEKIPITRIKQLYDVYGSYAKVAKEVGITDKTIKKHLENYAPISSTPSQLNKIKDVSNEEAYRHIPSSPGYANGSGKVSKTQHVATKASKVADNFISGNENKLETAMGLLLDSLQDTVAIGRASLRDRAIAWGIITERLQKSKELAIRQDEAEVKRYQIKRQEEELELRKREVAAMEKGVTISIQRSFQTVGDADIEDVEEEK